MAISSSFGRKSDAADGEDPDAAALMFAACSRNKTAPLRFLFVASHFSFLPSRCHGGRTQTPA